MQPLDTGNPGSYPGGVYSFQPVIGGSGGKFVFFNTSPYFIAVNIQGVTFRVSPWFAREIECPPGLSQPVTITPIQSINLSAAPISDVYLEQYSPGESIDEVYPQSVFGSLVSALAALQVINDGNPAVATVVEATPSGGPSSLKWNNDGSGYFGGGHDTVDSAGNIKLGSNVQLQLPVDTTGGNQTPIRLGPDHFTSADWLVIFDNAGELVIWDNLNGRNVLLIKPTRAVQVTGTLEVDGGISSVGGQASAGSFGAPVIVAQALNQHITNNSLHTLVSFTPPANGLYRFSGYVEGQGTGTWKPAIGIDYSDDVIGGGAQFIVLQGISSSTLAPTMLSGTQTALVLPQSVAVQPLTVYALSTSVINFNYQSSGTTINDHVWLIVERLA